jgi:hypothetical protein
MTVGSGAMVLLGSGSWGMPPPLGRCTVVKQMLYSCVLVGEWRSGRVGWGPARLLLLAAGPGGRARARAIHQPPHPPPLLHSPHSCLTWMMEG